MKNLDNKVVKGFGDEWKRFDQESLSKSEHEDLFMRYFHIFPFEKINTSSIGFDMGCGSGRWAKKIAQFVQTLHCIDPSKEALETAKINLKEHENVIFHLSSVDDLKVNNNYFDFGYSLGVLHHIPDTESALKNCSDLLKPGAPFLLYLYYRFDNKPKWYAFIWKCSEFLRFFISKMPYPLRYLFSQIIASLIYWPLSRFSLILEKLNLPKKLINLIPLSFYKNVSFYTMRTDSLDRFGTTLEQRFTKKEIKKMMEDSGFENLQFSSQQPFWTVLGYKKK